MANRDGYKRVIREMRLRSERPNPAVLDMVDLILKTAGNGKGMTARMGVGARLRLTSRLRTGDPAPS